jgi:hypothetical protein
MKNKIRKGLWASACVRGVMIPAAHAVEAVEWHGVVQMHLSSASEKANWHQRDTGLLRYTNETSLDLGQAMIAAELDLGHSMSVFSVLNYQTGQEPELNFSQLYWRYRPLLAEHVRLTVKAGLFYPEFSFENSASGWLSPYTYSFSAINSWIAEEQRTAGVEVKTQWLSAKPGPRQSLSVIGGVYKGNDTLGSMLVWRGWAMHDQQSVLNQSVFFARYPSIGPGSRLDAQAAWSEPFREIDHRPGYYLGTEWHYESRHQLKYYYYNNNADDSRLGTDGQFAWHTHYHSVAGLHRFNSQWRLLWQWLDGQTTLLKDEVIMDFRAAYLMINHQQNAHILSVRYDWFKTLDRDVWKKDDNNGDGTGWTLSYKYELSEQWQLGLEYLHLRSDRNNRQQLLQNPKLSQQQLLAVLQWQF